jgi:hypothetical protein
VALTETFDGGVDGATIVAGGNFSSIQGSPTYSAADAVHGALAMKAAGTSAGVRIDNPGTQTHSGSVYLVLSGTIPSGSVRVLQFVSSTNALLGSIRLHSDGFFDIAGPTNARLVASTLTWSAGVVYRLDWQLDYSGVNPVLTLRIFNVAESSTPADTLGPQTISTTVLMQRWTLGSVASPAGDTNVADTFREVDGLSWIGPFLVPVTLSPSGIASGQAFGTATVTENEVVAPTGVPSAEAWGTPALSLIGASQISPAGIASGEAWGAAAVALALVLFRFVTPAERTIQQPFDVDGGRPRGPAVAIDRGLNVYRLGGEWFAELSPALDRWEAADRQYLGGRDYTIDVVAANELIAAGFGDRVTPLPT